MTTSDIYFSRLILDEPVSTEKEIIWSNQKPNNKFQKWILRQSLV